MLFSETRLLPSNKPCVGLQMQEFLIKIPELAFYWTKNGIRFHWMHYG